MQRQQEQGWQRPMRLSRPQHPARACNTFRCCTAAYESCNPAPANCVAYAGLARPTLEPADNAPAGVRPRVRAIPDEQQSTAAGLPSHLQHLDRHHGVEAAAALLIAEAAILSMHAARGLLPRRNCERNPGRHHGAVTIPYPCLALSKTLAQPYPDPQLNL